MSNIKPDSIIACLDHPDYVQSVLNASMWASQMLSAPIGLLHSSPSAPYKSAIDYSGCLVADDGSHLLNQIALEEKESNEKLRDQGRSLLKQASEYCAQHATETQAPIYRLHRHASLTESLDYVDDTAQLLVLGHAVTCKESLSQLIRPTRCPALITREQFTAPNTALFAFDNRSTCHNLLDWLCGNGLFRNVLLHVVMVGETNERNKEALREAYARLTQSGIKCKKSLITEHNVTSALIYYQQQNKLDMLITGAFGESRLHEFLYGSDTRALLRSSKTPYLLYPKV